MSHTFDKKHWDDIWSSDRVGAMSTSAPNPHLVRQVETLAPGSAIDAGCGAGAEAIWLAQAGWSVTAADVSESALAVAEQRAAQAELSGRIRWVRADLSAWEPDEQYDLVTTHYAHPTIPQLEFYRRLASWVAPRGTLLIVGHLHRHDTTMDDGPDHRHDGHPPSEASATAAAITELLSLDAWYVATAEESQRTVNGPGDRTTTLHDVVVRATRLN